MKNSKDNLIPLVAALFIAVMPQVGVLPMWIIAWSFFWWTYVCLAAYKKIPIPGKTTRSLLTAIAFLAILLTYGGRMRGSGFVGLLVMMAGLKTF